jgi:DNA polymerase III epsilon subunit-like protein
MSEIEGLFVQPLRLLFYDTENTQIEVQGRVWSLRQDGYLPHQMVTQPKHLICWSAKFSDETKVHSQILTSKEAKAHDDSRIVSGLADLIQKADYVVAHNGDSFDIKNVNTRLLANRLPPLGSVQSIDTLKIARASFNLESNKLDYLAQFLGFAGKLSTNLALWDRCWDGEPSALKEMRAYNEYDSVLLEHIFHALTPYAKTLPRLVDAAEWRQELCPYCGKLERRSDGFYRTRVNTYPKWRCKSCLRNYRGWTAIGSKKPATVGL